MLVDGKAMMKHATKNGYAIPAFGFVNLEGARAIVNAAEKLNAPVILQMTEGGIKYGGLETLFAMASVLAKNAKVPVVIHLDHGKNLSLIKKAIDLGFTSVMYDGSDKDIQDNTQNAKEIKEYIGEKEISLEVEVGVIGGKEDDVEAEETIYANVEDVQYIFEAVKPTMIAVAVGTAHGLGHSNININQALIKEVVKKVNSGIVLHGGSGVESNDIIESVNSGIKKVNFDSELKKAYLESIKDYTKKFPSEYDIRKIFQYAIDEQEKIIMERIKECNATNKSWIGDKK